jgi:pilus assembly protein CpaB
MMKRRLLTAVAALLLAGVGAVLLLGYVRAADDRAMAGMQTTKVLVVTAFIPEGTPAEALVTLVMLKTLPAKAVAAGTLTDLTSIVGRVSTVDLLPGEQLMGSRFIDPATLEDPGVIKVPKGMQQLSVAMERPRMLGGLLTPGATVGVFVSLAKDGDLPPQTHLVLHKVLVTQVGEADPPVGDAEPEAKAGVPSDTVVVTFAVKARDAEKIVFGGEHGRLWLSLEPSDARTKGTQVVTPENVFK